MKNYVVLLNSLLLKMAEEKASDLHLSVGRFPFLRIDRNLIPISKTDRLSSDDLKGLFEILIPEGKKQEFSENKEVDFSYSIEDGIQSDVRLRVNFFVQRGEISCAMRLISSEIPTIEKLNLPSILYEFVKASQGFVLITGASSQGKSTTLAALINEINKNRAGHIITIEDPIEYIFKDDKCLIEQREVYQDTRSFKSALRASFRQDPDVIMVGEMRDPETIATAITAAETGHLVFATLHTNSASQTIHRIVDSFPASQQNQIIAQLSSNLLGIVSQRLIPKVKGGMVPACEVLLASPAVSNLIRENKIHEIPLVIETSGGRGMISMNRSLAELVKQGEISIDDALLYSLNPSELKGLL